MPVFLLDSKNTYSDDDEPIDTLEIARDLRNQSGLYALKIGAMDMAPRFRPGDIVIVNPYEPARPGDAVVVQRGSRKGIAEHGSKAPQEEFIHRIIRAIFR